LESVREGRRIRRITGGSQNRARLNMWSKLSESQRQFIKAQVGSFARRYLVIVAGWLLARAGVNVMPFLEPYLSQGNEVIGGLVIVAAVTLWSYRKHLHWNKKVDTALSADPDLTRKELEKAVEQGKPV
jgi:hypothetical protein